MEPINYRKVSCPNLSPFLNTNTTLATLMASGNQPIERPQALIILARGREISFNLATSLSSRKDIPYHQFVICDQNTELIAFTLKLKNFTNI